MKFAFKIIQITFGSVVYMAKIVSGHPCKYSDRCSLKSIALDCNSWDLKPEDCSIYKLIEDVEEIKRKLNTIERLNFHF